MRPVEEERGAQLITVLGRRPEPGRVKTRLAASLGNRAACEVHEALALDVLRRLRDWLGSSGELVLALTGRASAGRGLERAAAERFGARLEQQSEGGLGERIREALDRRFEESGRGSFVVGTDAPLLDDALLDSAAAALAEGRTGLAPSSDGGFVLLAAGRIPAAAFEAVPWGGAGVFAAVRAGLEREGTEPLILPGSEDVDDWADLERLALILEGAPDRAPATAAWLARRPRAV